MTTDFKAGDRVRVTRRLDTETDPPWNNTWVHEMDRAVGLVGTVLHVAPNNKGIRLKFEIQLAPGHNGTYLFPKFCLEHHPPHDRHPRHPRHPHCPI